MKYLKLFSKDTDYKEFIGGGEVSYPNVSYSQDVDKVYYNAAAVVEAGEICLYKDSVLSSLGYEIAMNLSSCPALQSSTSQQNTNCVGFNLNIGGVNAPSGTIGTKGYGASVTDESRTLWRSSRLLQFQHHEKG